MWARCCSSVKPEASFDVDLHRNLDAVFAPKPEFEEATSRAREEMFSADSPLAGNEGTSWPAAIERRTTLPVRVAESVSVAGPAVLGSCFSPMRPNLVRRLLALLLCAAVLLPLEFLFSWGNEGHLLISGVAARHVPKSMPLFFRTASARARIEYLGPEPDRWRFNTEPELKQSQEPDHYLNLETIAGIPLPPGRYDFYRKLEEKRAAAVAAGAKPAEVEALLPEHVGLQPYIAMEIYGRLKVAFREYRRLRREKKPTLPAEQNAVFYAGWLGHYVADASQPLHATVHYNGWTGLNPNGYTTD